MTSSYQPRIYPGVAVRLSGGRSIDWEALYIETSAPSSPSAAAIDANATAAASISSPIRPGVKNENISISITPTSSRSAPIPAPTSPRTVARTANDRLQEVLGSDSVDVEELKSAAWGGLPTTMRPTAWRLLLGHLPAVKSRREDTLARRRREYREAVAAHYPSEDIGPAEMDATMRQISVDIPRTCPEHRLFHTPSVEIALTRVLYIWAVRHPASGYVQGMNDLVTPFFYVFLSEHILSDPNYTPANTTSDTSVGASLDEQLPDNLCTDILDQVEADAYWCLTALLNDIQDYYTFSQPGIQRRVLYLAELVGRVDAPLRSHLENEGLDFLQFAFRWMNCLLMRELPFPLIIRVWDTYLSEPDGFALFHVFVCAALLESFSDQLMEMDFQDLVMFLQRLPTQKWTNKDIDVLLSQAYLWKSIFGASPSHLQSR